MPADPGARAGGPLRVARSVVGWVPGLVTQVRLHPPPEPVALVVLVVLSLLATVLGSTVSVIVFPPVFMAIPLLVGGVLLGVQALRWLSLLVVACLAYDVVDVGVGNVRPGSLFVVLVTWLVAREFARSRAETGLGSLHGDSVLLELKRRLTLQGALPELPGPWQSEVVVSQADGGPFGGDFVVSARTGDRLEVVLVDVSGKGVEAGTRALLLSGALGGLLGSEEPQRYMETANRYLVRQDWDEGFATSVHLTLDLKDGSYAIASAGHPPVAHFDAGSGRWGLDTAGGPALGLVPGAAYTSTAGSLRPGDALLLYTDGLVEIPGRDLEVGIDKLLGEAERLVPRGFTGGGELLVEAVAGDGRDDRGLVLIWRSSS